MKRGMLMLLLALPGLLPAMSARAAVDTAAWDGLLRQHVVAVRDGHATEVDYAGFMADRGRLQQYLAEAFVAGRLEQQLDDATKTFLSDTPRNRFEAGRYRVSSIFKWYREDFEAGWHGARSLLEFFALYSQAFGLEPEAARRLAADKVAIDFLDYDWRLNSTTESR